MARNQTTSAIVDAILRALAVGGALSAIAVAPNMVIALDKPMRRVFEKLDQRAQERELARVLGYMRRNKLVAENYENGLEITRQGRRRLKKANYDNLQIAIPEIWDGQWHIVLFDIPMERNLARRSFTEKMQHLGFKYLQQSVWVHPFPCRAEIEVVCETLDVSKYVTYIATNHIDHEDTLIKRFGNLLSPPSK